VGSKGVGKNRLCEGIYYCMLDIADNFVGAFAGVYGPNVDYDRRLV
jgi:hypothetical protein